MPPEGGEPGIAMAVAPTAGSAAAQPAAPAIWFFVAADCTTFALFFGAFMVERRAQFALFDASAQTLDTRLGLLNTLILISSSWLVALATAAARRGDLAATRRLLAGGLAVGLGFAVIKLFEYGTKIARGITPISNDFYGYYYGLTGLHFLHYLVGIGVLITLLRMSLRREAVDARLAAWIESGGIYWHMVDLLWVFLFPMIYLLGAVR